MSRRRLLAEMSTAEIMEWLSWSVVESEAAERRRLEREAQRAAQAGLQALQNQPATPTRRR